MFLVEEWCTLLGFRTQMETFLDIVLVSLSTLTTFDFQSFGQYHRIYEKATVDATGYKMAAVSTKNILNINSAVEYL